MGAECDEARHSWWQTTEVLMKACTLVAGMFATLAAASICLPLVAAAESKTEIKESDGKYEERYKNDDGTESEYHVDKKDGTHVYKDSNGVSVKEKSDDGKFKQQYKDGNCEQTTEKNLATGE